VPKLTTLLAALVLALSIPCAAQAQTRTGDTELGFSFSVDGLDADPELTASLRYGRYVNRSFELGGELRGNGPLDELTDSLSVELFALYDFSPGSTTTWYGRAGYFTGLDMPGDGLLIAALGFKTYVRDNTAFYWETSYGVTSFADIPADFLRSTTGLLCTF